MNQLKRKDLLYPELSYKVIGILFDAYNTMGYKYQERYYQRAIANLFEEVGLHYQEQVLVKLVIHHKVVANGFIDFIVEEKIAIEIKRGERFLKQNIDQLYSYLKLTGIKLGILANFTSRGLQFKRIVNINNS